MRLKTFDGKKLMDGIGQLVNVRSQLGCIRKCYIADDMCLIAQWMEGDKSCRLANVKVHDLTVTDDAGSVLYQKDLTVA